MNLFRMILAGVTHSWRVSAAVALGVATATAVIVGALLVGDSMRGSLRGLTLERLGKTESVVIPGGYFDPAGLVDDDHDPIALILFHRAVAETRSDAGMVRRAGDVQIIACDEDFWTLDTSGNVPTKPLDDESVVLNQQTARELGVEIGDRITIRLPLEQAVPADSPLGRRDATTEGLPRMKVVDIIPDRGLGLFSMSPSQASPKNVFVSRATVGDSLERNGQANALLFPELIDVGQLDVGLNDLGLSIREVRQDFSGDGSTQTIFHYYSLTSDRLLLPDPVVDVVESAFASTSVTTYLANAIEKLDASGQVVATVPYSTISAVDSSAALPLDYTLPDGAPAEAVPLVLNSWTAERLSARVGTPLRVAYYEPEVERGKEMELTFDAVVTSIVPITEPRSEFDGQTQPSYGQRPTVYNDPDLTPIVPGVTDQKSIDDWDLPFKLERKTDDSDDEYWNHYRLTPKAFLPLVAGRRLFGSRFGDTTGMRIEPSAATDLSELQRRLAESLKPHLEDLGWSVRPLRQQQVDSSRGTTPFDGLFLALSFFVILAAVMLIAMLFRLGLIQRTSEFGTLLAIGWSPRRVSKLVLSEGLAVAAIGVVIGIVGGILYAWFVLWALRNWWVGAVTVPFLTFHWTLRSLLIGAVVGWIVAAVTLATTVRWLLSANPQTLLAGGDIDTVAGRDAATRRRPQIVWGTAVVAILIMAAGAAVGGQAAAGGFVGGGMMLLIAALLWIHDRLSRPRRIENSTTQVTYSVGAMAGRNASRHPLRSTMTIGLMAIASFLIIAIAAFRLQPTENGTGGFELIAQTAQPIFSDLDDASVRSDLLGPVGDELGTLHVAAMRLRPGQDASCNNLYQATQPTVLGVPSSLGAQIVDAGLSGFAWSSSDTLEEGQTPWDLLAAPASGSEEDPVPMVLDQNTAMWSLQMMGGVGQVRSFEYEQGRPTFFRVVGLLTNSMLQGRLLVGESNFENLFPEISGHRFFLIAPESGKAESTAAALEDRLGEYGMDVSDSREVLSGMLAVQNTYLRTFQSLGGLGLLLGTIGLAVAQLRSVLERRKELAVLRAIGFTRRRLAGLVMTESTSLLVAGVGCGAACAALAVLPHALLSGLRPPIAEPIVFVVAIVAFGTVAGLLAARRVIQMPLLDSLRSD